MKPATYPGRYMLARTLLILALILVLMVGIGIVVYTLAVGAHALALFGLPLAFVGFIGLCHVGEQ